MKKWSDIDTMEKKTEYYVFYVTHNVKFLVYNFAIPTYQSFV